MSIADGTTCPACQQSMGPLQFKCTNCGAIRTAGATRALPKPATALVGQSNGAAGQTMRSPMAVNPRPMLPGTRTPPGSSAENPEISGQLTWSAICCSARS